MTKKKLLIGALLCIIITVFFLRSLIFNIKQPLGYFYTDGGDINFVLIKNIEKIIHLDFSHIFTLPEFFGFQNSSLYQDNFFLMSITAIPIYLLTLDPVTTYNIFIILTVLLSFFSMYCFVLYMTKQVLPSILAGIIFVFNPYIMILFPDSPHYFALFYIPLVFLFLEKYLKDKKDHDITFVFVFLSLQLLTSLYYFVFLSFVLFIYALVRLYQEKIPLKKLSNRKFYLGLGIFLITLMWNFYLYVVKNPLGGSTSISRIQERYSPFILNWLTTSKDNLLYGKISEAIQNSAPFFFDSSNNIILNLFFGAVPLIIFLLSFFVLRKSAWKKYWYSSLVLIVLSALFTFGPYIQITRYFSIINFPYFIYKFIPWFSLIRVPARMAIFTFFFISLVIGLTMVEISKKTGRKKFLVLMTVIIIMTIFEYRFQLYNVPAFSPETIDFYTYLKNDKSVKVILDYPIGNGLPGNLPETRGSTQDGAYLFLALLHKKTLLNGYASYLPDDYVSMTIYLSLNFPQELQLKLLKANGVDAIILHKDQFEDPQRFNDIKNKLLLLKVPLIKQTNNLDLFIL